MRASQAAHDGYVRAIGQVMPPLGQRRDGAIPDALSAGAANAFEYATRLGDGATNWVDLLSKSATTAEMDIVGMLPAAKAAAATWASGQLVGRAKPSSGRPLDFPPASQLVRVQRSGFLDRTAERVPE